MSGQQATVGGGYLNTAGGLNAVVGGGFNNNASGVEATVPGGYKNVAAGPTSFAAGSNAQATNSGSFVWADGSDGVFADTAPNQFLIRATGGVGIGTTTPASKLEVNGDVRVDDNRLLLDGGSDTNRGLIFVPAGLPGISVGEGPFLFGYNGGALGAVAPTTVCLSWDFLGNVWVSNNLSTASLTIRTGAIHVTGAGVGTSTAAFIQVATASNISSASTIINNTLCNGDPNAVLLVTPNFNAGSGYWNHPVGVFYDTLVSKWGIFNEDDATMTAGPAFNVLIIKN